MEKATSQTPQARAEELLVQEIQDEVLVYDLTRHRALCLNKVAATIWKYCDGETPVAEIARSVEQELKAPMDEQLVWLALDGLGRAHLLRERVPHPSGTKRISRRKLIQKVGAAIALPLITSVIAPTAAQAASQCTTTFQGCKTATVGCCCSNTVPPRLCVADASADGGSCSGPPC